MSIRYIPFFPDPTHGQAILDNFKRTLRYSTSDDYKRMVRRGMPLYDLSTTETVGLPEENGNLLIHGECLAACAALRDMGRTVDLVYIDPPFASGADYAKKIFIRRNPQKAAELEEAEQTLQNDELAAFEEKMYGDVWEKSKYLNWMYTNLLAIKSVMSDNASIYVHLDWHIGHYVKILMDEVFGEDNFQNEIVWHYYNKMQGNVGHYAANHDVIFLYTKSSQFLYHPIKEQRETMVKQIKRIWDKEKQKLVNAKDENGRVLYQSSLEKTIDDVWTISMLQPADKTEPVDYATQKPEALLERIVQASSNAGDTVADFFGGSGVTAAVAQKLGRKFIHADVGVNSIQTARDRLVALRASFEVKEVKDGVSLFRNPIQTMEKLLTVLPRLSQLEGLEKVWAGALADKRLGPIPVWLPNLLDSASLVLDEMTILRILHGAMPNLPPEVKKVVVYYIQVEDLEAIKRLINEQRETLVEIELRDLKEVLDELVINDNASWRLEKNATEDLTNPWLLAITHFSSDRVRQKIDEYNQRGDANPGKKGFKPIRISEQGLEMLEAVAVDYTSAQGPFHADCDLKIDKFGHSILDGRKTNRFWDGTLALSSPPLRLRFRNICGDETILPFE